MLVYRSVNYRGGGFSPTQLKKECDVLKLASSSKKNNEKCWKPQPSYAPEKKYGT